MSMLAEPRRKQKWSVDPRNSAWSNDESKFGQKMLERMGWSKGKGLGKTEQGSTEHIKVKVKNNSLGLGTAVNHEDNWIAHQDDFNQLLADLNNCHGQNNTESPAQDKGFSLEEKSKTSKKRVHYMKFTKGKDLSSRSETDLACIFGKRAKQETKDRDEGSSGSDSQEDKEDSETLANPDPEIQPNTVTSSLTMQEYFAQRMALLKKTNTASSAPSTPASTEDSTPNASDGEQTKKKRKKKKDRECDRDVTEEDTQTRVTGESVKEPPNHSQKKKKKKSRRNEEEVNGVSAVMEEEEKEQVEADEQKTVESENQDSKVSEKKKKKKKKRERDDGGKEEEVTEETVHKQKKKKLKK
ncbi:PIN2/TERF1-interacting telomerase inhibitor 1 [Danio aesculapii]|uniref:PIN2/TERF1-interacting telomerase inhibitor 1 n=1 Tax=Danio aesculapii TaxID=1142201 RepID=UPI0024BF7B65|nr:PIN2/TERF1-interacting telomerase inhibitor 1 [Danio aesculapii]